MATLAQLERAADIDNHRKLFLEKLASLKDSPEKLLSFLAHFASFQSSSAPAAAYLLVKVCQNPIFVEPDEELNIISDRGGFVGSFVADAVHEEFNSKAFPSRSSHVCLSQSFLQGVITGLSISFGQEIKVHSKTILRDPDFVKACKQAMFVGHGYGRSSDLQQIFNCFGFFIGSKLVASVEFKALDEFLTKNYPDLVDYLRHFQFRGANSEFAAYSWIQTHCGLDHAKIAMEGTNYAMELVKADQTGPEKNYDQVVNGFKKHVKLRQLFLERA